MRVWDRGRLAEFGIDIRGGHLHRLLCWLFYKDVKFPPRVPRSEWTAEHQAQYRKAARAAAVSCGCEPCLRGFLPWPFSWD